MTIVLLSLGSDGELLSFNLEVDPISPCVFQMADSATSGIRYDVFCLMEYEQ